VGEWQAIQYVGSGLSLIAFAIAAALFAYRARLRHQAEIIRSAPTRDRLEAIAVTAQFFRVDTSRLSAKQQEEIILAQLAARLRRDLLFGSVAILVAIMLAVIAIVAILYPPSEGQSTKLDNPQFASVVSGRPTEKCRTEAAGSPVQLFEKGWLVARLDHNEILAVWKIGDGSIGWSRQSGTFSDNPLSCDGVEGQQFLILGFRQTYCAASALGLRAVLGRPILPETRAWIQYQSWTDGLFIYGLPAKKAAVEAGIFQVLGAVFLNGQRQSSGKGLITQITVDSPGQDPYCSPLWYPAEKDLSLHPNQQAHSSLCARLVSPSELVQPRNQCSSHGF